MSAWIVLGALLQQAMHVHPAARSQCSLGGIKRPRRSRGISAGVKGPPPIASRRFSALPSPSNFTELIRRARVDQVTVVKYQAPWCRTCRAMAPRLDRIAKNYPQAAFYSLESMRNGKAAGERMHAFFVSRNATKLPYIEVYRGDELVEASTVPPTQLEFFSQMLGQALETVERLGRPQWEREKERLLALLQRPAGEDGAAMGRAPPRRRSQQQQAWSAVASRRARGAQPARPQPRRGAPLRGATGPRGKRGFS